MSGGSEGTFREYKGTKVRRYDDEATGPGGAPLAEASLLLRKNLAALFDSIAIIGGGGRSAAREYLSDHLFQVTDQLIALAEQRKDRVAAQWGAQMLSALVQRCIGPVLTIAESEALGKRWAGESLAHIDDVLEKHRKKFELNPAFLETKTAIQELNRRRDVVVDPGPIGQIAQKELAIAERYWERLRFYRRLFGDTWPSEVSTQIPRDYFAFEPLTAFCAESLPTWWGLLWPLIKKNNPDFMVALKEGKFPTLGIRKHMCWSRYWKDFRRHLHSLARQRGTGVTAL